jgi:hypothetical protein
MNTISDSLIEKLEELYPKPKPKPVKEEPPAVAVQSPAIQMTNDWANGASSLYSVGANSLSFPSTWNSPITQRVTYSEDHIQVQATRGTVSGIYPLDKYVEKIAESVLKNHVPVLEQMSVKECSNSYETNLKHYIANQIINLECRLRDHIKQEIDKLKCSPGTHI